VNHHPSARCNSCRMNTCASAEYKGFKVLWNQHLQKKYLWAPLVEMEKVEEVEEFSVEDLR
jgi:hypothetical protein